MTYSFFDESLLFFSSSFLLFDSALFFFDSTQSFLLFKALPLKFFLDALFFLEFL